MSFLSTVRLGNGPLVPTRHDRDDDRIDQRRAELHISALRARDYMQQRYGDTDEAAEKARLFCLMQMYVAQHMPEFSRGSLAVFGSDQGLVSEHLLRAVHHFFTRQPVTAMKADPPVADVVALAEQFALADDANT